MFKEERDYTRFSWDDLGDIEKGRPNLGHYAPVLTYRLLQYTLRDVLITELGVQKTNDIFRQAGRLAGTHFCNNMLNRDLGFNEFIGELQKTLKENQIGLLRVEKADLETKHMTLTVAEDLDCSGLPFTDEVVCHYDEGFIAGILEAYTEKLFEVTEVDCWASGDRVCRFDVRMIKEEK
jgi:uncharacterized protein